MHGNVVLAREEAVDTGVPGAGSGILEAHRVVGVATHVDGVVRVTARVAAVLDVEVRVTLTIERTSDGLD